ncbi:DNA-3-methyladenine glycosylase 2 family protein [Candidatus Marsarchaeota archaeon]|jgi:3-methyladenine DNA glycosylase/8-oxoguanine DNA glycosylase|nr:DNA-3-methyladenine glycosylase 2 family protein [Candidatus Marsarchaeota archaeon]
MQKHSIETLFRKSSWQKGVEYLRKNDPKLAKAIKPGFYVDMRFDSDYYGSLMESIIFQQLAGKAAEAILNRFKKLYSGRIPSPAEFIKTDEKIIREAGISPQKYSYMLDLCRRLESGMLALEEIGSLSDEEIAERLRSVKGVGRWTSDMFLIFSLGRTDVMPAEDLGVRKGLKDAYGLKELPDRKRIEKLARKWHPYCSMVAIAMWHRLDTVTVGDEKKKKPKKA